MESFKSFFKKDQANMDEVLKFIFKYAALYVKKGYAVDIGEWTSGSVIADGLHEGIKAADAHYSNFKPSRYSTSTLEDILLQKGWVQRKLGQYGVPSYRFTVTDDNKDILDDLDVFTSII